ncbi:EIF3L [Cordylochernes scorpioides]|uniref:Eukaryotic translation initiation factor 3 subunit L n=1 Tax=Cordylochernes scorpioides TaxID=51811 RepID=A0ABY6LIQ5_9ARAC|nr:EIF3L [Cordylochernes scorpioides]
MEYERQYAQKSSVPETVQNFIRSLQKAIDCGNVNDIQVLYETNYPKLTERFYSNSPWPHPEEIAQFINLPDCGVDSNFITLYKELYYRHMYAKVSNALNIDHRFDSYYNYCDLFNMVVRSTTPLTLELPNQWLWEIIDEFIYQFQSFSHFRSSMEKLSEDDLMKFHNSPKVWNVHSVLNVLHTLVDKSNINQQLEVYTNGGDPDTVAGEFGRYPLYKMLGYFSLVGLLRLHSLLGDYYQAIKVLENIELNKKSLYSRVPACQISSYYYVGFAYMMMRRYADAIRTFSSVLLYIQRTRCLFFYKTYQTAQVDKQTEQMYHLLAICLSLYPQRIDESVLLQLRDKMGDKMLRMQQRNMDEFVSCFTFACPKFLSPVYPCSGQDGEHPDPKMATARLESVLLQGPFNQQLKVFKDEVAQQLALPTIRSYLKLYTTMPIAKLETFSFPLLLPPVEPLNLPPLEPPPPKEMEETEAQTKARLDQTETWNKNKAERKLQEQLYMDQCEEWERAAEKFPATLLANLLCFKSYLKICSFNPQATPPLRPR